MSLKNYTKKLIKDYLLLFSLITIFTTLLRQLTSIDDIIKLKDIYIYMICALLGVLPSFIFYSKKEIPENKMRIRIIIHFIILEIFIISFASITGLATGIVNILSVAFQVAIVYALFRIITWMDYRKAANKINERLKEIKNSEID